MASRRSRINLKKIVVNVNPFTVLGESLDEIMVFRNGLLQEKDSDYVCNNSEVTILDYSQEDKICVWHT